MLKRVLRSAAAQQAAARLVGLYLRVALGSTRWTVHGAEHLAPYAAGTPAVFAFWHERLPLMPALLLEARRRGDPGLRAHVLVSRHRDGRFIGAVLRRFDAEVVEGSSSRADRRGRDRGGPAALRALLGVASGGLVVMTPDGPRGPRRVAAPGVAQIAAASGVPMVPAAAQTSRRHVLGSWDRMVLPLPFGRGVLVCGPAIHVARDGWAAALPSIEVALTAAVDEADRLCG